LRLAEALAPHHPPAGDGGKVQGLLLLGPVLHDRGTHPGGAEVLRTSRLRVRPHLLTDDEPPVQGPLLATELRRPLGDEQPARAAGPRQNPSLTASPAGSAVNGPSHPGGSLPAMRARISWRRSGGPSANMTVGVMNRGLC